MFGLQEGQNSFKIDLAIYTQYRRVTDSRPDKHLTKQRLRLRIASRGYENRIMSHRGTVHIAPLYGADINDDSAAVPG